MLADCYQKLDAEDRELLDLRYSRRGYGADGRGANGPVRGLRLQSRCGGIHGAMYRCIDETRWKKGAGNEEPRRNSTCLADLVWALVNDRLDEAGRRSLGATARRRSGPSPRLYRTDGPVRLARMGEGRSAAPTTRLTPCRRRRAFRRWWELTNTQTRDKSRTCRSGAQTGNLPRSPAAARCFDPCSLFSIHVFVLRLRRGFVDSGIGVLIGWVWGTAAPPGRRRKARPLKRTQRNGWPG